MAHPRHFGLTGSRDAAFAQGAGEINLAPSHQKEDTYVSIGINAGR